MKKIRISVEMDVEINEDYYNADTDRELEEEIEDEASDFESLITYFGLADDPRIRVEVIG